MQLFQTGEQTPRALRQLLISRQWQFGRFQFGVVVYSSRCTFLCYLFVHCRHSRMLCLKVTAPVIHLPFWLLFYPSPLFCGIYVFSFLPLTLCVLTPVRLLCCISLCSLRRHDFFMCCCSDIPTGDSLFWTFLSGTVSITVVKKLFKSALIPPVASMLARIRSRY